MSAEKKSNSTKMFIVVLILLIIIAGALFAMKVLMNKENQEETFANTNMVSEEEKKEAVVQKPKTLSGQSRPIAVMIDNHIDAMPQAGLLEADIVYEMIVEGGETRLMLILQDKDLDRIGPIRSSRHDFLDYVLENDAIYVHFGWSPRARSDISSLGISNINGIYESESESSFWRDDEKYAPHNAVTSTENILKFAERDEYRTITTKDPVLNYVVDEVNLENGEGAETVVIPYSDINTVKYVYDEDLKEYVRYSRGEKQVDWNSGETITTKNIIITFAKNTAIDSQDRQDIENVGVLDGYYITNGKAIKIECVKPSREEQTVYRDLEENEIDVNDGKTFIQICPINADVQIEGKQVEENQDSDIESDTEELE